MLCPECGGNMHLTGDEEEEYGHTFVKWACDDCDFEMETEKDDFSDQADLRDRVRAEADDLPAWLRE
jgi:hypothetical protein